MRITFTNPARVPRWGVRAMFDTADHRLAGFHVELPTGFHVHHAEVNCFGMEIKWDQPLPPGGVVVLVLAVAGGQFTVLHEMWLGQYGQPPAVSEFSHHEAILHQAYEIAELVTRNQTMRLLRDATLCALPETAHRGDQMFFCELDIASNFHLMNLRGEGPRVTERRIRIITAMGAHLHERVLQYVRGAHGPAQPGGTRPPDQHIREISALQLNIYGQHFTRTGTLDRDAVWGAFARFANGELRCERKLWKVWDAAPMGAFFFSFAEFGFLACETGVDTEAWKLLLAPLVAAQRVYIQAYRPDAIAARSLRFNDYGPNNLQPHKQVDQATKDALWKQFGPLSLPELRAEAKRNALDAFPGG